MKDKIVAFLKSVWDKVKAAYARLVGAIKNLVSRVSTGATVPVVDTKPADPKPTPVDRTPTGPVTPIVVPATPTPMTQETGKKLVTLSGLIKQTDPRYDPTFDVWTPGGGVAEKSEEEALQYIARFPEYF